MKMGRETKVYEIFHMGMTGEEVVEWLNGGHSEMVWECDVDE